MVRPSAKIDQDINYIKNRNGKGKKGKGKGKKGKGKGYNNNYYNYNYNRYNSYYNQQQQQQHQPQQKGNRKRSYRELQQQHRQGQEHPDGRQEQQQRKGKLHRAGSTIRRTSITSNSSSYHLNVSSFSFRAHQVSPSRTCNQKASLRSTSTNYLSSSNNNLRYSTIKHDKHYPLQHLHHPQQECPHQDLTSMTSAPSTARTAVRRSTTRHRETSSHLRHQPAESRTSSGFYSHQSTYTHLRLQRHLTLVQQHQLPSPALHL